MEIINEGLGVGIRKMKATDVCDVHEIETACYTSAWPVQAFEEAITHNEALVLYVLVSNEIAGFFVGVGVEDEYSVLNIAVKPACQKRGYATFILTTVIQNHFKKYENYFLEVRKSNKEAISLYYKLGFKYLYQRNNYYHDPVEDALVLKYSLSKD